MQNCENRPTRKCLNCGKGDDIKSDCPVGKAWFVCDGDSYIARERPQPRIPAPAGLTQIDTGGLDEEHFLTLEGTIGDTAWKASGLSICASGGHRVRRVLLNSHQRNNYRLVFGSMVIVRCQLSCAIWYRHSASFNENNDWKDKLQQPWYMWDDSIILW